ncbi:MAG TPA: alanine racemase [Candidatus Acidoferrales bacterium]|nr:alanine racemase [Candidatus Acidoferrales bacterium]
MTPRIQFDGRPVWAEISLGAIGHNFRLVRRNIGRKRKILAVVKANAYGLGAVPVSKALSRMGADAFGVTCSQEGIELREAGIREPILLLTGSWPGEEEIILKYDLTPVVARLDQLGYLERAAAKRRGKNARKKIPFHLKIDSGMNRLGISRGEVAVLARAYADCPHLEMKGTLTHFASSEDFRTQQNEEQERVFAAALADLRAAGVSPGIVHEANSGAICGRPATWADMVRPGAVLYGYHQGFEPAEAAAEIRRKFPLKPCLSLRSRIISLRKIAAGESVGYSARFVAERPSRIAVIAAGYADGIVRQRSNRGCVIVRSKLVPLVGAISMDLSMIDVTDVENAAVGDVVTIYGKDGEASVEVDQAARQIGTVTSDLLCALGRRVPRFYLA